MAKRRGGKGGGDRNDNRPNGKAFKKSPKSNVQKGKTVGGYSPAALARRAEKRSQNA